METLDTYLSRKSLEISLLNSCLTTPLPVSGLTTPIEVIKQKFQLASALKAEHAVQDWAITETAWAHAGKTRAGPFEFSYDYQRADLEVKGPSFYSFQAPELHDMIYTSSGMAAISALLLATAKLMPSADIMVLPGCYGETLELIDTHIPHLQKVQVTKADEIALPNEHFRILLLDTSSPVNGIAKVLRCTTPHLNLVVFDTTCFSSGSGRIGRVLRWARQCGLPLVLVRSHTKLDSLGVEYGRLGSAVFIGARAAEVIKEHEMLKFLAQETRQAVRLFGGAALPAHFPPFVGSASYRLLTDRRIACMLRNSRRTSRSLGQMRTSGQLHFAHGLYLTLSPPQWIDEDEARQMAEELSSDLSRAGMLLRHAGSFGFDFGATEWFHDTLSDRYSIRIAVPDLPTGVWDEVARAIATWWSSRWMRHSPKRADKLDARSN